MEGPEEWIGVYRPFFRNIWNEYLPWFGWRFLLTQFLVLFLLLILLILLFCFFFLLVLVLFLNFLDFLVFFVSLFRFLHLIFGLSLFGSQSFYIFHHSCDGLGRITQQRVVCWRTVWINGKRVKYILCTISRFWPQGKMEWKNIWKLQEYLCKIKVVFILILGIMLSNRWHTQGTISLNLQQFMRHATFHHDITTPASFCNTKGSLRIWQSLNISFFVFKYHFTERSA